MLTNLKERKSLENWHKNPFKCEKGDTAYSNAENYRTHLVKRHEAKKGRGAGRRKRKPIKNEGEEETDKSKKGVGGDYEEENKADKFCCDSSDFEGKPIAALFKHLEEIHPEENKVRCPFEEGCEVTLKNRKEWNYHKLRHKSKKMTSCEFCGLIVRGSCGM